MRSALSHFPFRSAVLAAFVLAAPAWLAAAELPSVTVQARTDATTLGFDGVVEAVRQTVVASQVAGAIVKLDVQVGDRVRAGQVLLRIDARAAEQNAAARAASVRLSRALVATGCTSAASRMPTTPAFTPASADCTADR